MGGLGEIGVAFILRTQQNELTYSRETYQIILKTPRGSHHDAPVALDSVLAP
jgi:hypothetical protein